jgi:hypothetical protein
MKYDAIIVLGGGYRPNFNITKETLSRMQRGIELFLKKKANKIIVSSGFIRKKQKITEAEVLFQYCLKKGLRMKDIIKEEFSLDTIGNAFFSRKYIIDVNKFSDLIVVTSDVHMKRSKYIFNKVFGKKYRIKFAKSITGFKEKCLENFIKTEERSLFFAKEFFNGLKDGDIDSIEKRLFMFHPHYTTFKRKDKNDKIFDSLRIKKIGNFYP